MLYSLLVVGLVVSLAFPVVMGKKSKVSPELESELNEFNGALTKVLVETNSKNYAPLISTIEALGGTVSRTYEYSSGLAAELPFNAVRSLQGNPDVKKISKDVVRTLSSSPVTFERDAVNDVFSGDLVSLENSGYEIRGLTSTDFQAILPQIEPDTYWNFLSMGGIDVWANGYTGQGSLSVIIDTGVQADHVMLGWDPVGPVIGGVDLTLDRFDPTYAGFDNPLNHYHGTHVAGILAGSAVIITDDTDPLYQSFFYYTGLSFPADEFLEDPTLEGQYAIPLFGMAPDSQIFGIKVFDHTGGGVDESEIIASIEYAIAMHESGDYDVDVISMSLGGGTVFDGRDLEDQVVDYATSVGITVVTSNGNEGPASMTTGSPGTANTAISVGAAANPINTRIFWDLNYFTEHFLGLGDLLFISETPQIYAFSSRGPTSDGRLKPDISATGLFVLSGVTGVSGTGLAWASGTSMSCPAVSGAVALLNGYSEDWSLGASPYDYKQALLAGAEMMPGYDEFDQGAGYMDAFDSLVALANDQTLGEAHPGLSNGFSKSPAEPKGIEIGNGVGKVYYNDRIEGLAPGHAAEFYFKVHPNIEKITLDLSNLELGADLGLNSFEVYIQSAMRSTYAYYMETVNVWGDAQFVIEEMNSQAYGDVTGIYSLDLPLMPGYVKIVIENDWTSFDAISADIGIAVEHGSNKDHRGDKTYKGSVNTGDWSGWIPVGFGSEGVDFTLSWNRDWDFYPTTDLDLVIAWFDSEGVLNYEFGGATLNSPEMVSLLGSNIDAVYVYVDGYQTNGYDEPWRLDVFYRG
jgi:subtilisin family serine protease